MLRSVSRAALVVCATLVCVGSSSAQSTPEFFAQKTIRFTITYEPGGSYDLYARLAATHMSKHIPGHPAMVNQYMPGAGGLVGILHLNERRRRTAPRSRSCRAMSLST